MRWMVILSVSACLGACGGGSGSTPAGPQAPVATALVGEFIDARVQGLSYDTGSRSGITDAAGRFAYLDGEEVTLTIGAIQLGRTAGRRLLTPLDLVDSSSADPQVLNRVRLLLLLDDDGQPDNGIQISADMRAASDAWTGVAFDVADFEVALAPILGDIEAVLNRAVTVPTLVQARAHLEASLACLYSGIFTGRFDGDDRGPFLLWVQHQRFDPLNFGDLVPRTGVTSALAYSEVENQVIGVAPEQGLSFDRQQTFVSGVTSSQAEFVGELAQYNRIENGVWNNTLTGEQGSFGGERLGGDLDAAYRLSGFFSAGSTFTPDLTGVVALDVFPDDSVQGWAINLRTDEQILLQGDRSGDTITVGDGVSTWSLAFDADGSDPANDLQLGQTAGFVGSVDGGLFDQADVIGTSCSLN